jgi:hypothetical protein
MNNSRSGTQIKSLVTHLQIMIRSESVYISYEIKQDHGSHESVPLWLYYIKTKPQRLMIYLSYHYIQNEDTVH